MKKLIGILLLASISVACESNSANSAKAEPVAVDQGAAPDEASAADEPAEKPAPAGEVAEVRAIAFDKAAFPGELPKGELLGGFAFVDAAGENFVAFTREDIIVTPDATDAMFEQAAVMTTILRIMHVAKKDEATKEVRAYTERIEACDADIVLKPKFGEWSTTDLDADGVAEASFAYTADCTSDVSPLNHKVFVTEGGEKHVLRGTTLVKTGADDETMGGEYTADKMDAAFLKKAKAVWAETSRGVGFE